MSGGTREAGMWETVQFAVADGWQATARLCYSCLSATDLGPAWPLLRDAIDRQ